MSSGGVRLSFDIATPEQFLEKLKEEQRSLENNLTSARHAINAAMTAWHLIEWFWGLTVKGCLEVQRKLGRNSKDIDSFRAFLLRECPELETMQCICEGSKHLGTSSDAIDATSVHDGAFNSAFSKGYDIPRLYVKKKNGTLAHFDNELLVVVSFWERFRDSYLYRTD